MKLIKQVRLVLAGAVAKTYEVDLCEVGPDQYVVNFKPKDDSGLSWTCCLRRSTRSPCFTPVCEVRCTLPSTGGVR